MNWKHLLEFASESVNDDLRLRNTYLMTANRILRNQIDGRVQLTDRERKALAALGAKLGMKALEAIATVAQPDTIIAWGRKFTNQKIETSQSPKSVGRPRIDREIEDLVSRMARENRSWGSDRIQGALKHLGYTISDQTVGNILKRHRISPAPERKKTVTWREFVRCHMDVLLATDFFTSNVWSWFGLMISSLLCFLHFSGGPGRSVRIGLQHLMRRVRCFGLRSLDCRTHTPHWIHRGEQRLQAIQGGEAILEPTVFAFVPNDEGQPPSQNRGKVVCLSAVCPRPIRDGPMRCGRPLSEQRKADCRKAA